MKIIESTETQLLKDYALYCEAKVEIEEEPLSFKDWSECISACWDESQGPNPYTEELK